MKLRKFHAVAIAAVGGAALMGLAACLQGSRQEVAGVVPPTASSGYGLFYMDEGPSAKLAYGAPNSDDVGLMMQCAKGSRAIDLSDVARRGAAPVLILASGGRSAQVKAQASSGDGATLLIAHAPSDLAPLQAFRRSGRIDVVYAGSKLGIVATPAERVGLEQFFTACERAA